MLCVTVWPYQPLMDTHQFEQGLPTHLSRSVKYQAGLSKKSRYCLEFLDEEASLWRLRSCGTPKRLITVALP